MCHKNALQKLRRDGSDRAPPRHARRYPANADDPPKPGAGHAGTRRRRRLNATRRASAKTTTTQSPVSHRPYGGPSRSTAVGAGQASWCAGARSVLRVHVRHPVREARYAVCGIPNPRRRRVQLVLSERAGQPPASSNGGVSAPGLRNAVTTSRTKLSGAPLGIWKICSDATCIGVSVVSTVRNVASSNDHELTGHEVHGCGSSLTVRRIAGSRRRSDLQKHLGCHRVVNEHLLPLPGPLPRQDVLGAAHIAGLQRVEHPDAPRAGLEICGGRHPGDRFDPCA